MSERLPAFHAALERDAIPRDPIRDRAGRPLANGGARHVTTPDPSRISSGEGLTWEPTSADNRTDRGSREVGQRSEAAMNSGARTGAQRLSLVVLALALAGAGYFAFSQADRARADLDPEATSSAERAAEAIGSRLIVEDLDGAIGEARSDSLTSFIERRVFVNEATESVKVWNSEAVIVFADEQDLQDTQNRDLRSKLARILESGTRTEVAAGLLHVLVAVPVGEDGGPSVVVELTRPYGQIASAGQPWFFVTVAAGLLAVLALVVAVRWRGRSAPLKSNAGFTSSMPGDMAAAFRNERETRQRAEQALEATRADESRLRAEVERLTRDAREAERAISEK